MSVDDNKTTTPASHSQNPSSTVKSETSIELQQIGQMYASEKNDEFEYTIPQEHKDSMAAALEQLDSMMKVFNDLMENEGKKLFKMIENRKEWRETNSSSKALSLPETFEEYKTQNYAPKVKICEVEGKGRIVIAIEAMEAAELITVGTPLLYVKDEDYAQEKEQLDSSFNSWILLKAGADKGILDKPQFWQLANAHEDKIEGLIQNIKEWREQGLDPSPNHSSEMLAKAAGMLQTNSFQHKDADEKSARGLEVLMSRYSHSCEPNAIFIMEEGKLYIHAIRDIEVNEELCISYINSLAAKEVRQAELKLHYNFDCTCSKCVPETQEAE